MCQQPSNWKKLRVEAGNFCIAYFFRSIKHFDKEAQDESNVTKHKASMNEFY